VETHIEHQFASPREAGQVGGTGVPELHGAVTHSRCPRSLYPYLPQLSAAAGKHAYSLSWQSLVGPDAPMCLLDAELFHTPDLPEDLRQAWHHLFTTPELHMLVHSLEEANSVGDLLSCCYKQGAAFQSTNQIHKYIGLVA
jgi:hypothetical protein